MNTINLADVVLNRFADGECYSFSGKCRNSDGELVAIGFATSSKSTVRSEMQYYLHPSNGFTGHKLVLTVYNGDTEQSFGVIFR